MGEIASINEQISRLKRPEPGDAKKIISSGTEEQGILFLAELFKGNGWVVSIHPAGWKSNGMHHGIKKNPALLLSDPRQPDAILLIVKFKTDTDVISYEQVKQELHDFENNLSPLYGCSQFCLLALNGWEAKAERLEGFNLLLQDYGYVEELMAHYSKEKFREPRIQLFAHNNQTYKKVKKLMQRTQSVAVVQATGTGKSFLIAKLLQDFQGERKLVMAPSVYIIEQVKEHIRWEADKIEFMTYARSMNLSESEIAALQPRMIVLDEFHRCGAEEWGRGVQNILNEYPQAFKFGTSATPIRYLDNGRDMSRELFDGNVAENLNLAQAIVRNILPMPKYVCALSTLSEEVDYLKEQIARSRKKDEIKKKLLLELDAFHIDWEKSRGIAHVLKKHLRRHMRKFIVFCRDEAHLLEMVPLVTKWFKNATGNFPVKTYCVYDREQERDANLDAFKNDLDKNHIALLFSINMLNEGLHVNEVSGVILLRPTESPNIFYQQIGRCLKVGVNQIPVIFDFVNNFRSIRTHDFLYDLGYEKSRYLAQRSEEGLSERCPEFNVNDEVREITEVFGEIKFKLDNWDEMFGRLIQFKKRFGHCEVPTFWKEDRYLWQWLYYQRRKYFLGKLEDDQFKNLNELGVMWNIDKMVESTDASWASKFEELCKFRQEYGHTNVPGSSKEYPRLAAWVNVQRGRYKKGLIEEYRISKLNSIGFDWNRKKHIDGRWQQQFDQLVAFKNEHGHFKIPFDTPDKTKLAKWVQMQRRFFKKGSIAPERKHKLDSIGFEWIGRDVPDVYFEKRFAELAEFKRSHDHVNPPLKSLLYKWINAVKANYKKGTLSSENVTRLKALGIEFSYRESAEASRQRMFGELIEYKKKVGHCNVSGSDKGYEKLNQWVLNQRQIHKRGELKPEWFQKLNAIGLEWDFKKDSLQAIWEKYYNQLVIYYNEHGTAHVPEKAGSDNKLSGWCFKQRNFYREGKLETSRVEKLNRIGFNWSSIIKDNWESYFSLLKEYKEKHGHSSVPQNKQPWKQLANWCSHQREKYYEGKLTPEQVKRFESLGFIWNLFDEKWQNQYNELKEFLNRNSWKELRSKRFDLLNWVSQQRENFKKRKLPEEKIMLLNLLNIEWQPMKDHWDEMVDKLLRYKQENGDCRVPAAYNKITGLGRWVYNQRKAFRLKKLSPEQIQKLNGIEFAWQAKEGRYLPEDDSKFSVPLDNPVATGRSPCRMLN